MELRVLRYFIAVAKEKNITNAAASLHLTQPTLSRQMIDLEKEFGKKLFIRSKRKLELTEAGEVLYRRAEEILALTVKAQNEISTVSDNIGGNIYIGSAETKASVQLQRPLKNYV